MNDEFYSKISKNQANKKQTCEKDFRNKKYETSRQSATLIKVQMMSQEEKKMVSDKVSEPGIRSP